jgi:hypothetical protein
LDTKIEIMKNENISQTERASVILEMTEAEKAETAIITRNSYLKDKFRQSLKSFTRRKIYECVNMHAEWTAKEVLVDIMQCYNPKLPPIVLLEMTQYILEEWEKIQAKNKTMQLA